MSLQQYAFDTQGTRRVQIFADAHEDHLTVLLDGNIIGSISTREELKAGKSFLLADRTQLAIRLSGDCFHVTRDGRALLPTSSVTEPKAAITLPYGVKTRLRLAYGTIFFVGAGNIVLGWLLFALQGPMTSPLDSGLTLVVIGAILLLLGFFVARKSAVALGIAVALYAVAALGLLFQGNLTGVAAHLVLLSFLLRGFRALHVIREAERVARLQH